MSHKLHAIDPAERAKIAKLQSEKSDAGQDKKVEWLYSGDKIDKDAYLLGKPIDKLLVEKEIEKPKETNPYAVVDLQSKIREDPLYEIKKREIEAKKRLLENPLKMKQLQEMISRQDRRPAADDSSDDDRRRRHDDRRHKEERRRHRRRSSSSSDSGSRHKQRKRRSRSSSREESRKKGSGHHSSSKTYGLDDRRERDRSPRSEDKPKSKAHAEIEEYKARIDRLKQMRNAPPPPPQSDQRRPQGSRTKMSEEERERKLREMQDNAKWRDDVRHKNVSKYKSDEKREDELQESSKSSGSKAEASNFFNSMMRDAYVSAEDRIKRNVRNIQRNESAFDRNFAKK